LNNKNRTVFTQLGTSQTYHRHCIRFGVKIDVKKVIINLPVERLLYIQRPMHLEYRGRLIDLSWHTRESVVLHTVVLEEIYQDNVIIISSGQHIDHRRGLAGRLAWKRRPPMRKQMWAGMGTNVQYDWFRSGAMNTTINTQKYWVTKF
jgi:hypothetical protein